MAMGTRKMRERQENLWYGGEIATARPSVLHAPQRGAGRGRVRWFLRNPVRQVLPPQTRTAIVAARPILSGHDDRVLRRARQRAGHRLATGRFLHVTPVPVYRPG